MDTQITTSCPRVQTNDPSAPADGPEADKNVKVDGSSTLARQSETD